MNNQHGVNEEKNINKEQNDLSIEVSDVTRVIILDTNNQAYFEESGDMPEEVF
jgi:hypothetical protein